MVAFLKQKYNGPLELAYDVGCGSGESTIHLTPYFNRVVGTDISSSQIEQAEIGRTDTDASCSQIEQAESGWMDDNLTYRVSPAEIISEKDNSVQMISVSQAAHWFNLPKFYEEGKRVLSPGGVMCIYGYDYPRFRWEKDPTLNGALDEALHQLYAVDLNGHWSEEMKIVDNRYKQFSIPYNDFIRDDTCFHEMQTSVSDVVQYCNAWSGYQNFEKKHGKDEGIKLISGLQARVMAALNVSTSPEDTILTKRTSFFLLMARK